MGHLGLGGIRLGGGPAADPSSMRVWIDPRNVTASGGLATSVPNLAPNGTPFVFPAGGTGTTPFYSTTRFNGAYPGFGFDGITERRLFSTIAGSFATGFTGIYAFHAFGGLANLAVYTSSATPSDLNSGFFVSDSTSPGGAYGFSRYDDTGTPITVASGTNTFAAPVVVTNLVDPVGNLIVRVNGSQIANQAGALPTMSGQTQIVIGGSTNAVDAAFGAQISAGEVASIFMFDAMLTGAELDHYERACGAVSGISW